jgi:hypothetical protein
VDSAGVAPITATVAPAIGWPALSRTSPRTSLAILSRLSTMVPASTLVPALSTKRCSAASKPVAV